MAKLRALWLVLLTLLLIIPPYSSNPAQALNQRKFALVIGIGKTYQSPTFRSLQHPEEDAQRMANHLQWMGFNVTAELIGDKATKDAIRDAIDDLGKQADNPHDLVVIYYSGHGAVIRGGGG